MKKILVVGGGGREHALVWKINQSRHVEKIFCAPGNPGIEDLAECIEIPVTALDTLRDFAQNKNIDLTVVGPENPLVEGIVDIFTDAGLQIFGPTKAAAQLEGSKEFAKKLMREFDIPTAVFETFDDPVKAHDYIDQIKDFPIVMKASGLAAGKGVVICNNRNEATQTIRDIMQNKQFGSAGDVLVIEEFLEGDEVSVFAVTDGYDFRLLSTSQDHKKALEGDLGKNTGGMGAYAPAPFADEPFLEMVGQKIVSPTLKAMQSKGIPFQGLLYIGLMVTSVGPKVLEYNVRFGDPETEVVLPLLDCDLVELMQATIDQKISETEIKQKSGYAFDVVLASGGYPGAYEKSKNIYGLDRLDDDIILFHAGTTRKDRQIVTAGGRVLNVVAVAPEFEDARRKVYSNIKQIDFERMYYRTDIGYRTKKYFDAR